MPRQKVKLTPPEFKRSDNPEFVSSGGKEYVIKSELNRFYISPWSGGELPKDLQGYFTDYNSASYVLTLYLRKTNRLSNAIFPRK